MTQPTIAPSTTVSNVVLAHSECAPVFSKLRIDFCCKGHKSVAEACGDRGLDVESVLTALEGAIAQRAPGERDPRTLDTPELVAHIVERHHGYLRGALPFILQVADKVARVHGPGEPRLVELSALVHALREALLPHLDEEEQELFPLLEGGSKEGLTEALGAMQEEHLAIGAMLERMRELTEDFRVPAQACGSYRALFSELEALEGDVMRHVHLENHVLAPRFLEQAVAS
jgi:regulator of cell morphogenesis and NO signaling